MAATVALAMVAPSASPVVGSGGPVVAILSLSATAVTEGTPVDLTATATDGTGVAGIDYQLDAESWQTYWGSMTAGDGAWGGTTETATLTLGDASAATIAAGNNHTCALLGNGTVRCWGANQSGQLGRGTWTGTSGDYYRLPAPVVGISGAIAIASGASHSCAVLATGNIKCWGGNQSGQLGNGSMTTSATPVQVADISTATAVAAGWDHTCALLRTGSVRCWGNNSSGQLGDGTATSSSTPVSISDLVNAATVAAGIWFTCASKVDGSAYCWGDNSDGRLGNGTRTSSPRPVQVSGLTEVARIAAGSYHACASRIDGTARCWGNNGFGQLGDGTLTFASSPVVVSGLGGAAAIAAGGNTTCATRTDGTGRCWGHNQDGQLGTGTTWNSSVPVAVAGLSSASAIAVGSYHACAVRSDGAARCWGKNDYLQSGTGWSSSTAVIGLGPIPGGLHQICVRARSTTGPASAKVCESLWVGSLTPTLVAFTTPPSRTNVASLSYSVVFSEAVTDLTTGDFSVGGTAAGCAIGVPTGSGGTWNVAVSSCAEGTVIVRLAAHAVVDGDSNTGPAAEATAGTVTIDRTRPTANVGAVPSSPVPIAPLAYGFVFGERVTGLTAGDFTLLGTATGCVVEPPVSTGDVTWSVWVTGCSDGTVVLTLAGDSVTDGAGNTGPATSVSADPVTLVAAPGNIDFILSSGGVGTAVTLSGRGFLGATTCRIGPSLSTGDACRAVTDGTLILGIPAGAPTGPFTVVAPGGTGTSAKIFTVGKSAALPTITNFFPQGGTAGDFVTISGANVGAATGVTFNGRAVQRTQITALSATSIRVRVPADATTGQIRVTTAGGAATSANAFNIYAQPTVTGLSITTGQPGQTLTISGTNLRETTGVSFGGADVTTFTTTPTATSLNVIVPAGAVTGKVTVRNPAFSAQSPVDFTVVRLAPPVLIAAGASHSCASLTDGTVRCWGLNTNGQLGDASTATRLAPVPVRTSASDGTPLTRVVSLAAGAAFTCVALSDGTRTARCWGANASGQLGIGAATPAQSTTPVVVRAIGGAVNSTLTGVRQVVTGATHACAALTDGTAVCWGANASGQLGPGTTSTTFVASPVAVLVAAGGARLTGIVSLAAGGATTCAALTDGTARCWGANANGQLGNGITNTKATPVPQVVRAVGGGTSLRSVVAVAAGGTHTCASLTDGTLRCWGLNNSGQLGTPLPAGATQSSTPVVVRASANADLTSATTVVAGSAHTCAILASGVRCWGANAWGQLGIDSTAATAVYPTATVGIGLSGATALAGGGAFTLACLPGLVASWGDNRSGQLGDATLTTRRGVIGVLGF